MNDEKFTAYKTMLRDKDEQIRKLEKELHYADVYRKILLELVEKERLSYHEVDELLTKYTED